MLCVKLVEVRDWYQTRSSWSLLNSGTLDSLLVFARPSKSSTSSLTSTLGISSGLIHKDPNGPLRRQAHLDRMAPQQTLILLGDIVGQAIACC